MTWPLLIILGINIENLAHDKGISSLLPENWDWVTTIIDWIQSFATSPWAIGISLFLAGCVFYEWLSYSLMRMDRKGSRFYRWNTKFSASQAAMVLEKDGILRNIGGIVILEELNERLEYFDLPKIPDDALENDEKAKLFSRYSKYISEGDFNFAQKFIDRMMENI